ncbi:MAG TPA: ABC transporter permease, partial [Noviherbaspirillum sp.]
MANQHALDTQDVCSLGCAAAVRGSARTGLRPWHSGLLAAVAWTGFGLATWLWPNRAAGFSDWAYTAQLGIASLAVAVLLAAIALVGSCPAQNRKLLASLHAAGPWLIAIPLVLLAWEILTAKLAMLPMPFFAPPQALIEVYADDWPRLADSVVNTLKLLGLGVAYGAVAGFLVGVSIGWSRRIGYWVHPVLRVLGPVPSTALLPLTFFFFPSSYSAAVFLIALATA